MRLLLIEDSDLLSRTLKHDFESEGHVCDAAPDAESALGFLQTFGYDAVVLDLMLPLLDGVQVLRHYRAQGGDAPVLALSAQEDAGERVQVLDAGADDYLAMPFYAQELVSRVRALFRRTTHTRQSVLHCKGLELDLQDGTACWRKQALKLTPKEHALLELLMRNRGRLMSRPMIFERLYDTQSDVSDRVVEVIMSTLRTKLERAGAQGLIETRRGFGYLLP
ncbi:response regulator transcription factor [Stenotrophomonas sp. 24(2023)]|uniref:response regulator transcription factor n=1 Tax=Stenotrophomonas sp. 24(2023) TaxID=3068324 RepID=UPI0027DEBDF1|nr:response regulator transcription factor [Stenotrophomonas sp. 24(2023)]WMJ69321.1 response regulator transcription factor [Stenotrophomonas sp. 24(2023)]